MTLVPLLFNLLAVFTGIRAIGDGTRWHFGIKDILTGKILAKMYVWIICSTAFSLVHAVALLTRASFIGSEVDQPIWLVLHSLIGLLFITAHGFVDAVFSDKALAHRIFGIAS